MATTTQTPPKGQQAPPFMNEQQQKQNAALTRVLQSSLCIEMADKYKVAPDQLFGVLMRTVFPKNKDGKIEATVEQFVAFLAVAQQYDLNPFTREIYAFPSKGGGVIPIVPVDGWVKIIQRKTVDGVPVLGGIRFIDNFEIDSSGKKTDMISITCVIKRKDMDETEITEYMHECARDTDPWKKWPARMLRHKALIQCARVAFGLSGIYDQDEAERIIEVENATGKAAGPEILMPQRTAKVTHEEKVTQIRVGAEEAAAVVHDMDTSEKQPQQQSQTKTETAEAEVQVTTSAPIEGETSAPAGAAEAAQGLFPEEGEKPEAPAGRPEPKQRLTVPRDLQLTEGMKKKIFAVLNSSKTHTEKELYAHIWHEYGLEHIHEIPKSALNEVLAWAGGDKLKIK